MTSFDTALNTVAAQDVQGLQEARTHYGDSWRKRGGVGAFMMLARKWDRMETILEKGREGVNQYDVLEYIKAEIGEGKEGVLDSVRDLRRYLMLVEAHLLETDVELPLSRDNKVADHAEGCGCEQESLIECQPLEPLKQAANLAEKHTNRLRAASYTGPFGFDPELDSCVAPGKDYMAHPDYNRLGPT